MFTEDFVQCMKGKMFPEQPSCSVPTPGPGSFSQSLTWPWDYMDQCWPWLWGPRGDPFQLLSEGHQEKMKVITSNPETELKCIFPELHCISYPDLRRLQHSLSLGPDTPSHPCPSLLSQQGIPVLTLEDTQSHRSCPGVSCTLSQVSSFIPVKYLLGSPCYSRSY